MLEINRDQLAAGALIVASSNEPMKAYDNYKTDQTGIWHQNCTMSAW